MALLLALRVVAQSTCANFPANFVPFASVAYVTAANSAGDHLVVGPLAGGLNSLGNVPLPAVPNQIYCDAQVQLAPQQFYANVYLPTSAERSGNFSVFAGLLVDPANNQPYQGGIIPPNQLGAVFAWRIGAAQTTDTSRNWSPTGSMSVTRSNHASVLLPNGKVLVVGSASPGNVAEVYDPASGTFKQIGATRLPHGQALTATLLTDGRVLIVGGGSSTQSFAELFDPGSGEFVATGSPATPRFFHTATLLADGRVLVPGGAIGVVGQTNVMSTAAAEVYDPKTGTFTATGSMTIDRYNHTATLLSDGRVLVTGGVASASAASLSSAEVYNPATGKFSSTGTMQAARANHFAVRFQVAGCWSVGA